MFTENMIGVSLCVQRLLPELERLVDALGEEVQSRTTSLLGQPILESSTPRLPGSLHSSMVSPEEGITPPEDMHFEVETLLGIAHISPRAQATAKTSQIFMGLACKAKFGYLKVLAVGLRR